MKNIHIILIFTLLIGCDNAEKVTRSEFIQSETL